MFRKKVANESKHTLHIHSFPLSHTVLDIIVQNHYLRMRVLAGYSTLYTNADTITDRDNAEPVFMSVKS